MLRKIKREDCRVPKGKGGSPLRQKKDGFKKEFIDENWI